MDYTPDEADVRGEERRQDYIDKDEQEAEDDIRAPSYVCYYFRKRSTSRDLPFPKTDFVTASDDGGSHLPFSPSSPLRLGPWRRRLVFAR